LVDRCENVYVSGWGGWIFAQSDPFGLAGTTGMRTTADAIKRISLDNRDFYFVVLKKDVTDILYGTFFGQDDNAHSISEHVDGGTSRYDQNGIIYQAICANCNGGTAKSFPTTAGVWSRTNGTGSNGCNLAAVKIAFNFAGVSAGLKSTVNGHANDTSNCVPLDAVLEDTVRNAKSYIWSFGDGSPDITTTDYIQAHTYTNVGVYLVRLIAIDSSTCNVADTVYTHIIARNDKAPLDFTYAKAPGSVCTDLDYVFINLSTSPPGKPFGPTSFIWDFGDQTGQIPAGLSNVNHSFKSAGTYVVTLTLADTGYCNYPDMLSKTLRISPIVKAQFVTPPAGCAPYAIPIDNTSLGGQDFIWDFGDGTPPDLNPIPTHVYANPGTYTITMIANDTNTCNKTDTTRQTIIVSAKPVSAFTYGPIPPAANTPIVFTNGSAGGIRYKWIFGDGSSEIKTTMDTAKHLYNRTDTFNACLVVFNQFECTDTVCHPVATLIHPLLDVPNAFTPGRFAENGIIKVMGFGITHMTFRIYNRYGQLVFQTNDPNQGWDGTYNGILQPMDVYGYTLEAEFSNGNRTKKKGDITLIR
ncbi:MAG TPA: PKD domain-containing protein, partial [Puia sp.]|nr:PKD domain-containing protein [Puia sp.]